MNDLNIALIGCGRIGFLLENDPLRYKPCTHYGGATEAGMKIQCACDINDDRLRQFAALANIPKNNTYEDYQELIVKEKPNLVIIATRTDTHAEIGIFASMNGAKTIICEKPISSNLKHAKTLLKECDKNNVNLIINHERRYESRYKSVKAMLKEKKIGNIKTAYAFILTSGNITDSNIKDGGGPLLHDGTHMIDILRYLLGDIKSVAGEIQKENRTKGFEDRATAWIKTESNIDIFLEAGGGRNYFVFELQIFGTEGKIIIGNGYQHLYVSKKSKYYSGFKDLSERPFPGKNGINYFKKAYLEAKSAMNGNPIDIISTGYDGYKALEAIHAIYLSSYLKSKRIELPINPKKINLKKIFRL